MDQRTLILDTQVFLNLQFDLNHSLFERLEELKKHFSFQLAIPKMVELEVKKKLKEKLGELHKTISKNSSLCEYFQINPCSLDMSIQTANTAFDKFKVKYDVRVLGHKDVECGELVKLYFEQKPPFSLGKKNEFPDAISLLSIDNSPFKYKDIISGDSDWERYYADKENVSTYKSLPHYIDEKLTENSLHILELKRKILSPVNTDYLLEQLTEAFNEESFFAIYLDHKQQNLTQSDCVNLRIKELNITDVRRMRFETKGGYEISNVEYCDIEIQLEFDVYLDLGRVEQVINGESIDFPKLKLIKLETNSSASATLTNGAISSFSLCGFSTTEWYIEL